MAFRIDPPVTDEQLAEFVAEWEVLENVLDDTDAFDGLFAGHKSDEFYEGLLAGYAQAFFLLKEPLGGRSEPGGVGVHGQILAFVASKVSHLRKERALRFQARRNRS